MNSTKTAWIQLTLEKKLDCENQVVILLNSLLKKYKEIKCAIKYGRDTLSLDVVLNSLRSKELELRTDKKDTEALYVKNKHNKGQTNKTNQHRRFNQKGNLNNSNDKQTCNYCHKEGHLKYDFLSLKEKASCQLGENN